MKCPNCNQEILGYPAISREDNKTEICSECGRNEALVAFKNCVVKDTLEYMNQKGYFKTENEYKKAMLWVEKDITPEWLLKDIVLYYRLKIERNKK